MLKQIERKKRRKKGRREGAGVIILLLFGLILESCILETTASQVFKVSVRVILEKWSNLLICRCLTQIP